MVNSYKFNKQTHTQTPSLGKATVPQQMASWTFWAIKATLVLHDCWGFILEQMTRLPGHVATAL